MLLFLLILFSTLKHVFTQESQIPSCLEKYPQFQSQCSLDTTDIAGFQNENALAVCCIVNDCCEQLESLLQDDCLNDCDNIDQDLLETIGLHLTFCSIDVDLPQCLWQIDDQQINQQRCIAESENLIQQCGFLVEDKYNYMDSDVLCCFDHSCCQLARDYLRSECNNACMDTFPRQDTPLIHLGTTIAKMWQIACKLPESEKECSIEASAIDYNLQDESVQKAAEDVYGLGSQQQPLEVQSEEQQQQSPCDILIENMQSDNMKLTINNLQGLCTGVDQITEIPITNICCDMIDRVTRDACGYITCSQDPIAFFRQDIKELVISWIDSYKCAIQASSYCDIMQTLDSISEVPQQETPDKVIQTDTGEVSLVQIGSLLASINKTDSERQQLQIEGFSLIESMNLNNELSSLEVLAIMPKFSAFSQELKRLNLEQRSQGYPVSIFALNNTIIEDLQKLIPDRESNDWRRTMLNHVSLGDVVQEEIFEEEEVQIQTFVGDFITIVSLNESQYQLQGCCFDANQAIQVTDTKTRDGALWIIDNAILPPGVAEEFLG